MEEATTVITNVHKTLSSGIPFVEAKKNLTDDLAEGTDAPIGDNSAIPSNIPKICEWPFHKCHLPQKLEDLKITTGTSIFTIFFLKSSKLNYWLLLRLYLSYKY